MNKRNQTLVSTTCIAATLIASASASPASASDDDAPLIWAAYTSLLEEAHASILRGGDCAVGDADCNACANDVQGKFASFKEAGGRDFEYSFDQLKQYSPANKAPVNLFSIGPVGGGHLQSFTRLSLEGAASDRAWFAATYGSGLTGGSSMYLVSAPIDGSGAVRGDGKIEYIYNTKDDHPGGSQGLGKYLFVAHDEDSSGGYLEIFDLHNPGSGSKTTKPTFEDKRAAAIGVTKLANGGLLALTKRAGENNKSYDFYYAHRPDDELPGWEHLGTSDGEEQVENVSLITECGTSDIYAITATGDGKPVYDSNYWKLYRLAMGGSGPELVHLDSAKKSQDSNCDARASGTAYASWDHNLAFYCAQKLASDTRVQALNCLVPGFGLAKCDGVLDCIKEFFKDAGPFLGIPGASAADCSDVVIMDNHMSLRQYW